MSADEDAERRQEEWTALLAIYGEEAVEGAPDALEWRVSLGERCGWLEVHLPLDYPSGAPPAPVILAPGLPEASHAALALELHTLHEPGAEVVYIWAEHLREAVPSLLLASRLGSTELTNPNSNPNPNPNPNPKPNRDRNPDQVHRAERHCRSRGGGGGAGGGGGGGGGRGGAAQGGGTSGGQIWAELRPGRV